VDDLDSVSSVTYEPGAVCRDRSQLRGRHLSRVLADHGFDVLLGVVVGVFAVRLLVGIPRDYSVDSWLALVDGRLVWQSGIPHHDFMNALNHGGSWTDEQWLSQVASYAIYRVGGLGLLGVVDVALIIGSIGAVLVAVRRRGAGFVWTLAAIPMCVVLISPSREIRTQEFAMPLFAAVVCLLSGDSRSPSRRVWWCLPILVLWANLHGSATQGATLVVLYAATLLWRGRRELRHDPRTWQRPLALAVGAVAAILITPYGLSIVGYYHATMVNTTLRQFVSEWQPVTSRGSSTVALCLLMGLALWSFGRNPSQTTLWEKLALGLLAAGTIEVVRNALFLGLFGLLVLPASLDPGAPAAPRADDPTAARVRMRINGTLAGLAAVGVLAATVSAIALPATTILNTAQSPRLVATVEHAVAADPSLKMIVDDRYSDYLLWKDPRLAGHIANDVRFELLSAAQLNRVEDVFGAIGPGYVRDARGYRLLVLDRDVDSGGAEAFAAEPGSRVLFGDASSIVILRSAAQAARG
jgi:hypothetical protein